MNIRKPIDYSILFTALDTLMAADLTQMELYCEIGRLVISRRSKGAAVAAAEYLGNAYPDASGFSPRNLRRMREFYRTYENTPEVLAEAMTIGWTRNVAILEAELTVQEKEWYIQAVKRFGWSMLTLLEKIKSCAHTETPLDRQTKVCYTEKGTNIRGTFNAIWRTPLIIARAMVYGGDHELTGQFVVTTSLFCCLTLFLWIFLLEQIGLI